MKKWIKFGKIPNSKFQIRTKPVLYNSIRINIKVELYNIEPIYLTCFYYYSRSRFGEIMAA
jgi:hypothetical protein